MVRKYPDHKLIRGRKGNKQWTLDEKDFVEKCKNAKLKNDQIYNTKVKTPTQFGDANGKDHPFLEKYVESPEGGVNIVHVDAKGDDITNEVAVTEEKVASKFKSIK